MKDAVIKKSPDAKQSDQRYTRKVAEIRGISKSPVQRKLPDDTIMIKNKVRYHKQHN